MSIKSLQGRLSNNIEGADILREPQAWLKYWGLEPLGPHEVGATGSMNGLSPKHCSTTVLYVLP